MAQPQFKSSGKWLEGKGEGFCSEDPSPFLTSLFIKHFWFMLHSAQRALPTAPLSSGHAPSAASKTHSPAPAAFLLSCFANICHVSYITLTTNLCTLLLSPCLSHPRGTPQRQVGDTQLPAGVVSSGTSPPPASLPGLICRILPCIFRNTLLRVRLHVHMVQIYPVENNNTS